MYLRGRSWWNLLSSRPVGAEFFGCRPQVLSESRGGENQRIQSFVVPQLGKIESDRPRHAVSSVVNTLEQEFDTSDYSLTVSLVPTACPIWKKLRFFRGNSPLQRNPIEHRDLSAGFRGSGSTGSTPGPSTVLRAPVPFPPRCYSLVNSAPIAIPARLIPMVLPPSLRPGFGPQADIRSRDESIARPVFPMHRRPKLARSRTPDWTRPHDLDCRTRAEATNHLVAGSLPRT